MKKIVEFFKIYWLRKISVIFIIFNSLLTILLFYFFYSNFLDYVDKEIKFWSTDNPNYVSTAFDQNPIYIGLFCVLGIIIVSIIVLSILYFWRFYKLQDSGNLILTSLLVLSILVIVIVSLLLSFQPQIQKKIIENPNGSKRQIKLDSPSYAIGWAIFFIWLFQAMFLLASKRNYGFFIPKKIHN
ncbi:hypothetical protein [Mycoplasmopsis pulmonis]|uniref:hypothetical protein n=1 Tax=Mycoplasmopsis pulmonis TaxID=2107 RepID=UPI002ACDBCFA|nr:hypothetical protein [Mycoplasmopsis pulmonis]MDZ7293556.1 hypothetical protein [Mycoplasmopsis pulmonis]